MYTCINVLTKVMYFQQILYLHGVNKYYGYCYNYLCPRRRYADGVPDERPHRRRGRAAHEGYALLRRAAQLARRLGQVARVHPEHGDDGQQGEGDPGANPRRLRHQGVCERSVREGLSVLISTMRSL